MSQDEGWSLTESDPVIFNALINELGVRGLQFEELWSLDDDESVERIRPVYALIFLFKYLESHRSDPKKNLGEPDEEISRTSFFANQVITNACATLAILNAIMNIPTTTKTTKNSNNFKVSKNNDNEEEEEKEIFNLGQELENFKKFSIGLDSQTRGELVGNSDMIRSVHNSFARPDPFQRDRSKNTIYSEDSFHFISYVPIKGKLYELDGLKKFPICHGKFKKKNSNSNNNNENININLNEEEEEEEEEEEGDWLSLAKKVITSRINTFSNSEVNFNLMAICGDRLKVLNDQKLEIMNENNSKTKTFDTTTTIISNKNKVEEDVEMNESSNDDDDDGKDELKRNKKRKLEEIERLIEIENLRRVEESEEVLIKRHNYIGLIHRFMICLARSGKLKEIIRGLKEQ